MKSRSQWPRGQGMNCLRPLERWVVGSNPLKAWKFFCVCIGSSLAMGWSPVQGILQTVLGLRNWSETKRLTYPCTPKWEQQTKEREMPWWRMLEWKYSPTSALDGGQWSASRPKSVLTCRNKDRLEEEVTALGNEVEFVMSRGNTSKF
jgi:hypothetical protein